MKKVLLVDDSAFMRMILKKILVNAGFEIAGEASNGKEAVRCFSELKPDIITMDITMQELSGLDALREIVAVDPTANVIMVSAMGQEKMVTDAVRHGAKGFIVKPFKDTVVVEALSKI